MNVYDLLLTVLPLLGIMGSVIVTFFIRSTKEVYSAGIHIVPSLLSFVHYLIFGFNYIALPLYAASLLLVLIYFVKRFKIIYISLAVITVILTFIPTVCRAYFIPFENYSSMSYTQAFKSLHETIKAHYPFAELKKIDMDSKYARSIKGFQKADQDNSKEEYYAALKEYLMSFPDGHFLLKSIPEFLFRQKDKVAEGLTLEHIGGSYGFTVMELDDGQAVAGIVRTGSDAERAGIKTGSLITRWNGKSVQEAVDSVSLLWNWQNTVSHNFASKYHMKRIRFSLLTRGPEGEQASVSFINEDGQEKTVTLLAKADQLELLKRDLNAFYRDANKSNLSSKMIDGAHGYIRLNGMPSGSDEAAYEKFKSTLYEFKNKNVKDLIIDARNNSGGHDKFGARILELLTKEEIYYLHEFTFDSATNEYKPGERMIAKPRFIGPDIPIVILVNNGTISAGEGFVFNARKLPNVKIAGMTGTHGSFGSIIKFNMMPENYFVLFPEIACFDENGKIMIDTDHHYEGGVQPDIKIPIDRNAVRSLYEEETDYELEYVLHYLDSYDS